VRAAAGLASLWLAATPALGCGHCVEDKVAAVYDHAALAAALAQHRQTAYFAIDGPLQAGAEPRRVIARALRSVDGVDSRSLRLAADAGSLSLSYDAERTSSGKIMDILNRTLAPRRAGVSLLKVVGP
jgi:hypothetical protein